MSLLSSVLADSINDVSSTRKVYLLAGGLALLGVLLIAVTVWFWRNSRHDPELLAPLESMSDKKFYRLDAASKQEILDAARPAGAEPMRWGVHRGETVKEPEVDLAAINRDKPHGYDDLRDPSPAVAAAEAASVAEGGESASDVAETSVADEVAGDELESSEQSGGAVAEDADSDRGIDDEPEVPVLVVAAAADDDLAAVEPSTNGEVEPRLAEPAVAEMPPALVIRPLDHDLAVAREAHGEPQATNEPSLDPAPEEDDDAIGGHAIDPLLRMVDRNGS